MATTTNFGWETPDDTDLVKDGAAAIRTALNGVDTSFVDLKGGTTGQVLSKASGTDLDFTWVAADDTNAIQNAIIDSKGDLIVGASADTPARFPIGSNGYVLTADSAETYGVKWAAPATGGGKVLQVISATTTTATTIASTTLTDTTITVNITPTSSSSKILVLVSFNVDMDRNAVEAYMGAKLWRNSTGILDYGIYKLAAIYTGGARSRNVQSGSMSFLDSPATTSTITYKVQGAVDTTSSGGTSTWQYGGAPSTITVLEIGA